MYNHFIIIVFDSQSYLRSIKKSIFDSIMYRTSTSLNTLRVCNIPTNSPVFRPANSPVFRPANSPVFRPASILADKT